MKVSILTLSFLTSLTLSTSITSKWGRIMGHPSDVIGSTCSGMTYDHYNAVTHQGAVPCDSCDDKIALTYKNQTVILSVIDTFDSSEEVDMIISHTAFTQLAGDTDAFITMHWECLPADI